MHYNMIEVYVGITLLGLGYLLNQQQGNKSKANPTKQINVRELDSQTNAYDSRFTQTAKSIDARKASQSYVKGIENPERVVMKDAPLYTTMAGVKISKEDFRHNNMKPFGLVKQPALGKEEAYAQPTLERFTGAYTYYQPKQELGNMFEPVKNSGNIHGMQVNTAAFQERIAKPRQQNNVLPFDQVRVGPALNRGYGSKPDGGYQQLDAREYAMPKNVDELRMGSNPKVTFEGRVVDGQKGTRPGLVGAVAKNRVDTYYVQKPERYLKTTGAYLKPGQPGAMVDKATNRQETSRDYAGGAYVPRGETGRAESQEPLRNQLRGPSMGVATLTGQKTDDYGKTSIQIYANERDITTTRTRQGNISSLVKALVAPLQDLVKVTRKDYFTEHARSYGSMQSTMPPKQTIYDPNQVARTTLKETLLNTSEALNVKGPVKLTIYDPNQVARTTLKETMLHDADLTNIKGDRTMGAVYDPDVKAKTTVRQTLDAVETNVNLATVRKALPAHDPTQVARITVKQTTLDVGREYGNVDRAENFVGGYENAQGGLDMPATQREELLEEYMGNPVQANNDGYQIVDAVPRDTQRQELADTEYYGTGKDVTSQVPMSYEDAYNAVMDGLKEETLKGRDPTQSGVKVFSGSHGDVAMHIKKQECDGVSERVYENRDRVVSKSIDNKDIMMTRTPQTYDILDDRLDDDIMAALKENPYALPSFADKV